MFLGNLSKSVKFFSSVKSYHNLSYHNLLYSNPVLMSSACQGLVFIKVFCFLGLCICSGLMFAECLCFLTFSVVVLCLSGVSSLLRCFC